LFEDFFAANGNDSTTCSVFQGDRITKKASIMMLEGNIVKMRVFDNEELEAEDISEIHQAKLSLVGNSTHSVLLISGEHTTITREARELAAKPEYALNRRAKAIVISSIAQRIIGNYFLKVNKPRGLVKLFTSEEAAVKWLRKNMSVRRT
jgi:hypothetical protein